MTSSEVSVVKILSDDYNENQILDVSCRLERTAARLLRTAFRKGDDTYEIYMD